MLCDKLVLFYVLENNTSVILKPIDKDDLTNDEEENDKDGTEIDTSEAISIPLHNESEDEADTFDVQYPTKLTCYFTDSDNDSQCSQPDSSNDNLVTKILLDSF